MDLDTVSILLDFFVLFILVFDSVFSVSDLVFNLVSTMLSC